MALIMKSKPVVDAMRADLEPRVARLKEAGVTPTLGMYAWGSVLMI